jgi:hypothetical protein
LALDNLHLIIDIVTPVALCLFFVLGLVIKSNIADLKTDQANAKSEIREDFNRKHAENSQAIAVHAASDEQKFVAIQSTLTRMDAKLDRLNGHS